MSEIILIKILLFIIFILICSSECLIELPQPRDSWFSSLPFTQELEQDTASKFNTCSSPSSSSYGDMTNIIVTPCNGNGNCPLVRGTNVTLDIEFISKIPAKNILLKLSGVWGWFTAPFGTVENMCSEGGIQCPLKVGVINKYQKIIYIRPNFPTISLNVKIKISDDIGYDIACAMIPVEIQ